MGEDSIFLLRDGELVEMAARPYDTEEILQRYLEQHPKLLGGDQMDPESPRRWVVVSREIAVAGEERGVGFVDHAFLDQDGIPTLVEVKRSSDARIRREVVGQLLDYAANAVVYWPVEAVRAAYEGNCVARGVDPADGVQALIGPEGDVEAFWASVASNLERGRIRMVFVADRIPAELRRIVEFLNEQMSPAEVIAVEVRQYLDDVSGLTSLVPRVVGNTAAAERKKSARPQPRSWDASSVFERISDQLGEDECAAARSIYEWGTQTVPGVRWGKGTVDGSFTLVQSTATGSVAFLAVYTSGHVELRFNVLKVHSAFVSEAVRRDIVDQLNAIAGIRLPAGAHDERRSMPLAAFVDAQSRAALLKVLEDVAGRLQAGGVPEDGPVAAP
jgi:hypothetical protein